MYTLVSLVCPSSSIMSFGYTGIDELLVLNKIEFVSQGGCPLPLWFSFGNLSFFLSFFLSWVLGKAL